MIVSIGERNLLRFDAASATDTGQRAYQEDAIMCDFVQGNDAGFAVVADGMGGHAAGDVASRIASQTAFGELSSLCQNLEPDIGITSILRDLVSRINQEIRSHASQTPATKGMGTTFVATFIHGSHLHWISIGDSPLYLFRNGQLKQINQDHSLAPQIDLLVTHGLMSTEAGRFHPDRSVLTSVLVGGEIAKIDCPDRPLALKPGDILLMASDGIQTLQNDEIENLLARHQHLASFEINAFLMTSIQSIQDPDQDNTSLTTIKVLDETQLARPGLSFGLLISKVSQHAGFLLRKCRALKKPIRLE